MNTMKCPYGHELEKDGLCLVCEKITNEVEQDYDKNKPEEQGSEYEDFVK